MVLVPSATEFPRIRHLSKSQARSILHQGCLSRAKTELNRVTFYNSQMILQLNWGSEQPTNASWGSSDILSVVSSCLIPSCMRPCTHHRLSQSYLCLWFSWVVCCRGQRLSSVSGWVGWIKWIKIEAEITKLFCFPHIALTTYDLRAKLCKHGKNSNQAAGTVPWHVCAVHFGSSHELTAAHSRIDLVLYK